MTERERVERRLGVVLVRGYDYPGGGFVRGIGGRHRWPFVWACLSCARWGARLQVTIATGPLCLTVGLPSFRIEYEGRVMVTRDGQRRRARDDEPITREEWLARWHFRAAHGGLD